MRKSAVVFGRVFRSTPVALLVAVAPLAGCLGGGETGRTLREGCLAIADSSRQVGGSPAAVALLGDIDPTNGAMRAHGTRLVRFSLPGGAIEAERSLGRPPGQRDVDALESLRLDVPSGPLLATARNGRDVVALLRNAAVRDRLAVIDAQSLQLRCSHPLAQGVRYGGLVLGRSRVYAYGVRREAPGRWDAVVTVSDLRTGDLLGTRTLREAERASGSKDWFVYWGALSEDEQRLILSYHGSDSTGADLFRLSPEAGVFPRRLGDRRCARRPPGSPCSTDASRAHGAVIAVGGRFVAATGTNHLLELNRNGRVTRRLPARAHKTHLMDFAVDTDRRLAYVSSCGRQPTIQRLDLAGGGRETIPSGTFCGKPLAVHADRYLVLDADGVGKLGYPRTRPAGLRLLDLRNPGGGRRIPLSPSAGALDAVVVQLPP